MPLTVKINKNTAGMMIQQMGNSPYKTPFAIESKASFTGIRYTRMARRKARAAVNTLAWYPFIFFMTNAQKRNKIGNVATNSDKKILLNGSITCVHFILLRSLKPKLGSKGITGHPFHKFGNKR